MSIYTVGNDLTCQAALLFDGLMMATCVVFDKWLIVFAHEDDALGCRNQLSSRRCLSDSIEVLVTVNHNVKSTSQAKFQLYSQNFTASDLIAVSSELLRTHSFCSHGYNVKLSSLLLSLLHKGLRIEAYVESLFGIVMHKDGDKG